LFPRLSLGIPAQRDFQRSLHTSRASC
jgi:hypothetical protein